MINYSDDEIFNLKNKTCLTFDPFDTENIANKYTFENKEKLLNYINAIQNDKNIEKDKLKEFYNLKKVNFLI